MIKFDFRQIYIIPPPFDRSYFGEIVIFYELYHLYIARRSPRRIYTYIHFDSKKNITNCLSSCSVSNLGKIYLSLENWMRFI